MVPNFNDVMKDKEMEMASMREMNYLLNKQFSDNLLDMKKQVS